MELSRKRREARWFLHAHGGSTLGPYDDQRVLEALRSGEILTSDRIYSAEDGTWTILASHPYFRAHPELSPVRRSDLLASPPSPRKLRVKTVASPPPIPVLPRRETSPDPIDVVPEPAPPPLRMHDPHVVHLDASPPVPEAEREPPPAVSEPARSLPEEKGLLEALPIGPANVVQVEPLVLTPPPSRPAPVFREEQPSEEIAEEDDLEGLARLLEQALVAQPKPASEQRPVVDASIPERPEIKPVFLEEPRAEYARIPVPAVKPRVIQIELKMPERAWAKAAAFFAVVAIAALLGFYASNTNKTRDQKGFHLSDPSSPIAVPQEASDPIPPLKAPTRPQRD